MTKSSRKASRWKQSIALSKKHNRYKEAMETTSQSGDRELAEELLVYFTEQGKKECFASGLFVCYDLLRADIVLELAWINNLIYFAFPYLLQFIREYTAKVDELIKDKFEAQNDVKAKEGGEGCHGAAKHVHTVAASHIAGTNAWDGRANPPMGGGMGMPPMPSFGMPPMGSY